LLLLLLQGLLPALPALRPALLPVGGRLPDGAFAELEVVVVLAAAAAAARADARDCGGC
jgi:hypothetical protein